MQPTILVKSTTYCSVGGTYWKFAIFTTEDLFNDEVHGSSETCPSLPPYKVAQRGAHQFNIVWGKGRGRGRGEAERGEEGGRRGWTERFDFWPGFGQLLVYWCTAAGPAFTIRQLSNSPSPNRNIILYKLTIPRLYNPLTWGNSRKLQTVLQNYEDQNWDKYCQTILHVWVGGIALSHLFQVVWFSCLP